MKRENKAAEGASNFPEEVEGTIPKMLSKKIEQNSLFREDMSE